MSKFTTKSVISARILFAAAALLTATGCSDDDKAPEAEKKQSFERIMELMQSMQILGNPPSDLVGESNKGPLDFDAQGNPFMKDPEQCKMS